LEHPHQSALENHDRRTPRLGRRRSVNLSIGISPAFRQTSLATYFADMFAERNSHADLDTIIRQFEALRAPEAADHFSSIKCPTTILSGSEDGTHQAAFALKELIPDCEMKILHGAGHACQIEQPWLFDRYMIDFLKSHNLFVE
jgi:pimeloyl-ACP methyl ester carboxylesterase